MSDALQPFFLPTGPDRPGQRFCVYHPPRGTQRARGAMLYLHPFAEELNKSRRMAALQSRALAQAGFAVLQIDLQGCGDSSGELAQTGWSDWVQDSLLAVAWLLARHDAPLWLWGLRCGSLLAAAAALQIEQPLNFLFWQPTPSGKTLLNQFLRLKTAAGLADDNSRRASADQLRPALAAGQTVKVAGYEFGAALAHGLESAKLTPPPRAGIGLWFEMTTREPPELLPATQTLLPSWQAVHQRLLARALAGPAFWQTQEIEDAPTLIAATLRAMKEAEVPV